MKKEEIKTKEQHEEISRKDALKKMSTYGKYAALTALGTYAILTPMHAITQSAQDNVDVIIDDNTPSTNGGGRTGF